MQSFLAWSQGHKNVIFCEMPLKEISIMRRLRFVSLLSVFLVLVCAERIHVFATGDGAKMTFTTKSGDARARFDQGLAIYDRARLKDATPFFNKAVEADPNFVMAYLFRGLAGDSVPDIRKAAEMLAKVPVTEPERLFVLSWKAQSDSQTLKAVEYMEQAVKLLPDPRLHMRLGQLYSATNRRNEAIAEFKRVIENDPKFAPVYNALGQLYITAGDFDKAIEARETYAKYIPMRPNPFRHWLIPISRSRNLIKRSSITRGL